MPSAAATRAPSPRPSPAPSAAPSPLPSPAPSALPVRRRRLLAVANVNASAPRAANATSAPAAAPAPTRAPTSAPTRCPTASPAPTTNWTWAPSAAPSAAPTARPSVSPPPSPAPTSAAPSLPPTGSSPYARFGFSFFKSEKIEGATERSPDVQRLAAELANETLDALVALLRESVDEGNFDQRLRNRETQVRNSVLHPRRWSRGLERRTIGRSGSGRGATRRSSARPSSTARRWPRWTRRASTYSS